MNHLRQMLDEDPMEFLIPHAMLDRVAGLVIEDAKRHGERAMCFDCGDVLDTEGLKIIPELCIPPYDVSWFEFQCIDPDREWLIAVLIVVTPELTRLTGFKKSRGTWELRYAAELAQFNASEMRVFPADELVVEEVRALRARLAGFLSAMHCSNVGKAEHKPEAKLQKAREKRGKQPLFSYWTLQLDARADGGGEGMGGTHAGPRLHLRRGHPRQYAQGKWTWVQACVVGNKAAGMVHKDYVAGPSLLSRASH